MHDDLIERVLKAAGRREKPPVEVEQSVRESLRKEWQAAVADERARRRRRVSLALAAAAAVAVIGASQLVPRVAGPPPTVATVAVASAGMRVRSGRFGAWNEVVGGQSVAAGQTITTGRAGRGALSLPGGISARLDRDTRIALAASDRFVIERGAIYVDAGRDGGAAPSLAIETPAGVVRHVGTQYEVRLQDGAVRLRIREGRVQWQSNTGGLADGRTGEQLLIDGRGTIDRSPAVTYGASWEWASSAAPPIDIDGLALADFLSWAGRELGCQVVFDSHAAAAQAGTIRLHGSVAGLAPPEALEAVLATTKLRAVTAGGRIAISVAD